MKFFEKEKERYDAVKELESLLEVPLNASALRNFYTEYINEVYEKGMIDKEQFDGMEINIDISDARNDLVNLSKPFIGYSVPYERVEEHITGISGPKEVEVRVRNELKLGRFTLVLEDYVCASIPDNVMALLFNLGKVAETMNEASISTAVICENT